MTPSRTEMGTKEQALRWNSLRWVLQMAAQEAADLDARIAADHAADEATIATPDMSTIAPTELS